MAQNDFLSFLADPKERGAMLQTVMQSLNRGIVANALGGTVDMGNALANLGRAGVGYVGHKTGLLSADQMPGIVDVPTGGSEWFGEQMRRTGMVSGERNQLAEGFAGLLGMAGGKGIEKAAPEIARGLLAVERNALAPRTITGPAAAQRGVLGMGDDLKGKMEVGAYQIDHKPMTEAGGAARLHDLAPAFGDDIYGPNALQFFGSGDAREREVLRALKQVRGKPDAMVTIYRGVPDGAKGINAGDWVTLSPQAAAEYGNVVKMQVPASHITSWPDSLLEFGYFPPAPK